MFSNLLLALALLTAPPQVWTVDDDGPAAFSSIAQAIPMVAEGDVLLVMPGSYGPFVLDKSLSIVAPAGAPRPVITGMNKVTGAHECSFVRLKVESLEISSVPARVAIDDCEIGPPAYDPWAWTTPQAQVALEARQCAQLLVTRTLVKGSTAYAEVSSSEGSPFCAAHVVDTEAAFVACNLVGGHGPGDFDFAKAQGGTGLRAEGSTVTLAGTSASGGHGAQACGFLGCASCGSGCAGPGGHAVWAQTSEITVRGNSSYVLSGGGSITSSGWPKGKSIRGVSSVVIASGVALPSGIDAVDSAVLTPSPSQPFLLIAGDDTAGQRTIQVFGPSGDPALLALSLVPDLAHLAGVVEGSLWLQLSEILLIVPLVTQGQAVPESYVIAIPSAPELIGLTGIAQALCQSFPGALDPSVPLVTNAGQVALH